MTSASKPGKREKRGSGKTLLQSKAAVSVLSSLVSIAIGLLFGFIMLLVFNPGASLGGFLRLLTAGLSGGTSLAYVIYKAVPLIFVGLAVGFAFKTGLFNIGATGQYTVGACCALLCVLQFGLPWYIALPAAALGGALWGAIPGVCKALFNVNEVITAIMFNWIGLYLVNFIFVNLPVTLDSVGNKTRLLTLSESVPKLGLDKLFGSSRMNLSIFAAIIVAILMFFVLQRTTFGYELKACGFNREASRYAGISAKRNIILSMVISGALAGLGGGFAYLSGTLQYSIEKNLLAMGFNGIPVALLALSHPIGIIFSAFFISYIQVGGEALQPDYVVETIDMIIAVIIYLSAFSLLMKETIVRIVGKRREAKAEEASRGAPPEPPDVKANENNDSKDGKEEGGDTQ